MARGGGALLVSSSDVTSWNFEDFWPQTEYHQRTKIDLLLEAGTSKSSCQTHVHLKPLC